MFLQKYLDEFHYEQLIDNYKEEYLNLLNEANFIKIYNIFVRYGFYYLNDIILKYPDIFMMGCDVVIEKLEKLKKMLGEGFVYIIGNKLSYLDYVVKGDE